MISPRDANTVFFDGIVVGPRNDGEADSLAAA